MPLTPCCTDVFIVCGISHGLTESASLAVHLDWITLHQNSWFPLEEDLEKAVHLCHNTETVCSLLEWFSFCQHVPSSSTTQNYPKHIKWQLYIFILIGSNALICVTYWVTYTLHFSVRFGVIVIMIILCIHIILLLLSFSAATLLSLDKYLMVSLTHQRFCFFIYEMSKWRLD